MSGTDDPETPTKGGAVVPSAARPKADLAGSQNAVRDVDFGESRGAPAAASTVHEHIAVATFRLRRNVALGITGAFVVINALVMLGLYQALMFDFEMLRARPVGYERFVSTTVIGSLLTATTVQLGAIMFAVAKFLFPFKEPE